MFNARYPKVATSSLVILAACVTAISSLTGVNPAQAQLFPNSPTRNRDYNPPRDRNFNRNRRLIPNTVPRGFVVPVEYEEEKILLAPEETVPISLLVAANIKDNRGNILIPYGSEILGQIEPDEAESGSFFAAESIVFTDGSSQSIEAVSAVVTRKETVKEGANAGDILQGAAIGATAAAVLSEIFGDIGALEVLGGAGAGALAGLLLGGNEVELVSIDPNNDLDLTLLDSLTVR
ncbi:MAG: hypothetical protein AAFQ41_12955 [Cyanobacteria bacterium J06623_7]